MHNYKTKDQDLRCKLVELELEFKEHKIEKLEPELVNWLTISAYKIFHVYVRMVKSRV